jgi:hypothetical protein
LDKEGRYASFACEHSPNHASQLDAGGKRTDKRFDEERAGEDSSLPARLDI